MMKRCLVYILFLLLLVLPQATYATFGNTSSPIVNVAIIADSVKGAGNEVVDGKYRAENKGFDIRQHAFQKRFRLSVTDPGYSNSGFFSHLYLGGGVGVEHIIKRGAYNYAIGPVYNFYVGKDISQNHSLSVALRLGENTIKGNEVTLDRIGVQLNHHFHLTRYFLGYTPKRLFDVSTILGVGYQHADVWKLKTDAMYGMLGLRTGIRLVNKLHLSVDPYIIVSTRGYNGMTKNTSSFNYNISYGATLSLIYTLRNEYDCSSANKNAGKENSVFDKHYIFFEGGPQALYSNIRFKEALGRYFAFGYGYWFDKYFAIQAAAGYSSGGWSRYRTAPNLSLGNPEYTYIANVQYFFARAELVANLLTLPLKKEVKQFNLALAAGYEYGFQWKYTDRNTNEPDFQTSCYYGGLTTALLAKWLLPQGKALYLSPRVTFVNFGVPYKAPYELIEKKYTDKRFSLALGLEFGLKRRPYVKESGDEELYKFKEDGSLKYRHGISILASFGTNYLMERGFYNGESTFNVNAGLSLEYQPLKYFGLRVKGDYTSHNFNDIYGYAEKIDDKTYQYKGLWRITYKTFNGLFDVKFDLSNMIHGYDPHRKWDVAFYAGPFISKHIPLSAEINEEELRLPGSTVAISMGSHPKLFIGAHAAFNCRYLITRHIGVFGEFGVKIHTDNSYLWAPHLDYNPVRVLDLEFGVCYKIR